MGLDVYLYQGHHVDKDEGCGSARVELPSAQHPDHLFKIGYFRSSYNEGGINNVLRSHGLDDLYDLFGPGNEYVRTPDWPTIIARCDALLAAYDHAADRMRYRAFYEMRLGNEAKSAEEALAHFMEATGGSRTADMGAWSGRAGFFCPGGMTIFALINGRNSIGTPCTWVIAENTGAAWYRQALEIVKETAEWVLAQPDPKAFHVHWSG